MAKSKDWGIGFSQGYACALASLIRITGTDTNIDEIIAAQFPTVKSLKDQQVDEYDLEVLLPIVKEHEAKKARQYAGSGRTAAVLHTDNLNKL